MANIRFFWENLWKNKTIAYSSQAANFPAINTQNRWKLKPWRSRYGSKSGWGNFVIDSSNNKLYFRESTQNMIQNPNFENWASATNLDDWEEILGTSCTVNRESTIVKKGTYSVNLTQGGTAGQTAYIRQNSKTLTAGITYRVTFWYKNNVAGKQLYFYINDSAYNVSLKSDSTWVAGTVPIKLPNSTDWTQYEIEFEKHASYSDYRITFLIGAIDAISSLGYFDDSWWYALPEQYIEITPGTYSAESLAAEIETQLDTLSANDYSVVYNDTTNKFEIYCETADVEFKLLLSEDAEAVWDTIGFTEGTDTDWITEYIGDNIRIHTEEVLTVESTTNEQFSGVFVFHHNISDSGVVRFEASNDDFATIPLTVTLIRGDDMFCYVFPESYDYLQKRIVVTDIDNPDGYIELGLVWFGDAYEPYRGYSINRGMAVKDESVINISDGGQISTIQRYRQKTYSDNFDAIFEMSTFLEMLIDRGESLPLVIFRRDETSETGEWTNPQLYSNYVTMNVSGIKKIAGDKWQLKIKFDEEN